MTLKAQLQQALSQLTLPVGTEHTVTLADDGQRLECHLVALDRLGCAFTRLVLESDRLKGLNAAELKQVAEKLAGKLTYLLEPISPIETDAEGCVVQLRSNPPQKDEDRTTYYELIVARAGEVRLCRYTRSSGQSRQMISAEVTREVLLRLADDFSAAAS